MNKIYSVVFFCYGGRNMGMGHIVRIETLAKAFIEKFKRIEITVVIPAHEAGVNHLRRVLENKVI